MPASTDADVPATLMHSSVRIGEGGVGDGDGDDDDDPDGEGVGFGGGVDSGAGSAWHEPPPAATTPVSAVAGAAKRPMVALVPSTATAVNPDSKDDPVWLPRWGCWGAVVDNLCFSIIA